MGEWWSSGWTGHFCVRLLLGGIDEGGGRVSKCRVCGCSDSGGAVRSVLG